MELLALGNLSGMLLKSMAKRVNCHLRVYNFKTIYEPYKTIPRVQLINI